MAELPLEICDDDRALQSALSLLRNKEAPVEARLAALQALQAASFSVVAFQSCRGEYIAALREVAEDSDAEIRQRVLGMLAREKDGFAQSRLLLGLREPEKALVPPEKALQLLSYDVHAEAYPVARAIVENPPNQAAKREALRLLGADASAGPLLEKVLRDKGERPEIRQISAAALNAVQPEKLRKHARQMLLDTSEGQEIQTTSLTALAQFGDDATMAGDDVLLERVERLQSAGSRPVRQSAKKFLGKFRQ